MIETNDITRFGMKPHKEGGYYAETACGEKPYSSHIYYLLPKGETSCWHRIPCRELWLWHDGGTVVLQCGGRAKTPHVTETLLLNRENPCVAIAPGTWQTSLAKDADTLVSCVCVPGYCDETNEIYKKEK